MRFARRASSQALMVVGGQLLGQLFLLASIPVLTRHFGPEEFGAYQLGLALALIFQPLATLRVEFIIPVTGSEDHARRLYRTALAVTATFACAAVFIPWLVPGLSQAVQGTAQVLGVMLGVNSFSAIDNAVLIRRQQRRRLAARNLLYGATAAPAQCAVAVFHPDVLLLALVTLLARLVAVAATRVGSAPAKGSPQVATDRETYGLRRGATTTIAGVVSNSSVFGLTVLAGALLSTSAAAQIGTAQRVSASPISLVGQALSQIFQTRVVAIQRAREPGLTAATRGFVLVLAVAAAPLAVAMIVLGPLLARPILGAEWQQAGNVIAILAVPTCLQLVIAPTIPILVMQRREGALLRIQIVRLATCLLAGGVPAAITGNALWAAAGYATATAVAYLVTIAITLRICGQYDQSILSASAPGRSV